MARPNKYYTNIKPNFERIKEMIVYMHECDIARYFGITRQSWNNYRKSFKEFDDLIKNTKAYKSAQYKKNLEKLADGCVQEKRKKYIRDENGKVIEEIEQTYLVPSEKANNLLLNNLDDHWSDNPKELQLKKEELQIKKDNSF